MVLKLGFITRQRAKRTRSEWASIWARRLLDTVASEQCEVKNMLITKSTYWLVALCLVPYSGFQSGQLSGAPAAGKGDHKALKLFAEYKHNILEDLSADGRLMLFYQTSKPMRTFTYRSDTDKVKPDQPEVYDDLLRIVELESGREVGRIGTEFYPRAAQFLPNTQKVFYKEPKGSKLPGSLFKLWD